jgi:hypothetical protein
MIPLSTAVFVGVVLIVVSFAVVDLLRARVADGCRAGRAGTDRLRSRHEDASHQEQERRDEGRRPSPVVPARWNVTAARNDVPHWCPFELQVDSSTCRLRLSE